MQAADCSPRVKCRLRVKWDIENKKNTRINSGSNEDLRVFVRVPALFFQNPENAAKLRFLTSVKHYIINLEFWNSPFCWNKFSTSFPHLTFVDVTAILNFVSAIRSGTYQLFPRISFFLFSSTKATVLITFKPPHVLFVSNGLGIPRNTSEASRTRQHNNRAS